MRLSRVWAMPDSNTFAIPVIRDLILRWTSGCTVTVDPFANVNHLATVTNDLDPDMPTDFHMDALDFLQTFDTASVDAVLFDPPYSPRQLAECYKRLNKSVTMQTTQAAYWSQLKSEIRRILKPGGVVITCGWNSTGVGGQGMELEEVLLVCHGGMHNDTIVTVQTKLEDIQTNLFEEMS